MNEPQITLAPGVEDAGLPVMLAEMIRGNLANRPERVKDFNALEGAIYMKAQDAEVDMTLVFKGGALTVHGGLAGKPLISITTDSGTLMDLANLKIVHGMPDYFDGTGREILGKLLKRELKIKGLLTHPLALTRLTRVMSVA